MLQHERRSDFGMCGINCNQKHNLMSSISFLPLQFCTRVDVSIGQGTTMKNTMWPTSKVIIVAVEENGETITDCKMS